MATDHICPLCGNSFGYLNHVQYEFYGRQILVCANCGKKIDNLNSSSQKKSSEAELYFKNLRKEGHALPEGLLLIKSLLDEEITEEEFDTASFPEIEYLNKKDTVVSASYVLYIFSGIFLILSILLFFNSNVEVKGTDLVVANLQGTVFTAASAIISAMFFIGGKLITALSALISRR